MYNLQEAYLGVYYDLDEAEKVFPYGKVGDKLRSLHNKRQEAKTPEEKNRIAKRQEKINKEYNVPMEQLDLYDLIFDYLLDEGYADTEEAATVIMANMSEDWIDDIYEEVLDEAVLGAQKGTIRFVMGKGGKSIKYVQSRGDAAAGDRAAQERAAARAAAADRQRSGRNRVNAAQAEQARKKSIETMNSDPNESPDRHTITRHHKGRKDFVDLGVEYHHDEVPTDYRARRRRASGR